MWKGGEGMEKLIEKVKSLPAYEPNTWGVMCKADQDDPIHFPCRAWIKRVDVLKILEKENA